MPAELMTCGFCGQPGFTATGLRNHQGNRTCQRRAATICRERERIAELAMDITRLLLPEIANRASDRIKTRLEIEGLPVTQQGLDMMRDIIKHVGEEVLKEEA